MTFGDYVRSMNDYELADLMAAIAFKTAVQASLAIGSDVFDDLESRTEQLRHTLEKLLKEPLDEDRMPFQHHVEGMPMNDEMELKRCPFCGAEATICGSEFVGDDKRPYWYVHCYECGADAMGDENKEQAIQNWNRRVEGER